MVIRKLDETDLNDSLSLSQMAFQYVLSEKELEEKISREKFENVWGFFQEGNLAAKMKILSLQTFINGKIFPMGGICSVATWPEYRNKGMVKKLLLYGLNLMKNKGQLISLLCPFSFTYYRKYGWEHVIDRKKYTIQRDQLPCYTNVSGHVERKNLEDIPILNRIYEMYAINYNGMLKRSGDWWRYRSGLFDKRSIIAVYYNHNHNPKGYIIYEIENNQMNIKELIYLDEDCRRGLWQFVSNHDSMIEKVIFFSPSDDPLPFLLPNPSIKQEIIPYFMARIVDAKPFLEQYRFKTCIAKERYILHLEDQFSSWNIGTYEIYIDENQNNIVHQIGSTELDSQEKKGLSCDIQTLSSMLLGYQRPLFLYEIDRIKGNLNEIQRWEKIIPENTPYLADHF